MAKIGFIGLGNMGGPMAINLVKAGHAVTVFDLSDTAIATLVSAGASAASTAVEAVKGAEYVISMLPAGKHVESLYLTGDQPLFDHLAEGTLVIDSSTIDAQTAKRVGGIAAGRGISFMDAPVSGGVGGAVAGTLSFMVGASDQQFSQAKPILEVMGKNIFHAGVQGSGQIAKACNNMLLAILMTGTSEALNMGVDNGLDPKVLSEIMRLSSGGNWALEVYNPYPGVMPNAPASNGYQGGFQVDLMSKDLGLAMALSEQSNSATPMGTTARDLYKTHGEKGNGSLDFSSIIQGYQK
ncbi:MAG: 3-hydroxyisobutyrate dehydrogenase [Oceanospirillaceae bacterium]|nr:3-hydroxyisobutyrate dehydrogenase [Oceanospirillaceae bacterium]